MELKNFFAQDLQGNVIPSPTVYLYAPGTTTLATGLNDKDGNALANPFTGAANGQVTVAAPDGDYDMRVVGGARDTTMRVRFIDSVAGSADTLRQDLASTAAGKGVQMIGGAEVPLPGYAALRAYTGEGKRVYITGILGTAKPGIAGVFQYDQNDTTTTDNGGTIIVGNDGRRWKRDFNGEVSVLWFMTEAQIADVMAGTALIDTFGAITAALASFGGTVGGTLRMPAGRYLVTDKIVLPKGIRLIGDGYWQGGSAQRQGTTSIYGVHTGAAILSLKGSHACTVSDLTLEAGAGTYPKTGLLLGRSGTPSAGWHKISRVGVWGYFSVAGIYSIASEDNLWEDVMCWIYGGGAMYGFVTSTHDVFGVDGLYTSSNLTNTVIRLSIFNTADSAGAACIYMENSQQMGSWLFLGGYLVAASGDYIRINNGALDGLAALGPFTFVGMGGEILGPVAPYTNTPFNGIQITANGSLSPSVRLPGLTVMGARFQLINANGLRKIINHDSAVTLVNPNIVIPPVEDPATGFIIHRDKVIGGIVDVGLSAAWVNATLESGWGNQFGSPYAPAGYSIDATGRVSLRGTVSGGSGVIFTLPVGYRPTVSMFFPTNANGAAGKILVDTSGNVTLFSGTATEVDLATVQFSMM